MTIIQSISQAIASEGSCVDLEVVVTKPQMMPGGAIQVEDWEDHIYDVDTMTTIMQRASLAMASKDCCGDLEVLMTKPQMIPGNHDWGSGRDRHGYGNSQQVIAAVFVEEGDGWYNRGQKEVSEDLAVSFLVGEKGEGPWPTAVNTYLGNDLWYKGNKTFTLNECFIQRGLKQR